MDDYAAHRAPRSTRHCRTSATILPARGRPPAYFGHIAVPGAHGPWTSPSGRAQWAKSPRGTGRGPFGEGSRGRGGPPDDVYMAKSGCLVRAAVFRRGRGRASVRGQASGDRRQGARDDGEVLTVGQGTAGPAESLSQSHSDQVAKPVCQR
ncbi:hypothetical protein GCM10010238_22050 [Streptomyces griseoviridis]|uniref:Uncharacterized protein n=1 Tax=Streptomyces griseoviridis TaxID=45398 RepID=A0A918GEW4_STRGD|nr:hypothetical protein GCM10010238_22050 [Streptomyces niveoruber]